MATTVERPLKPLKGQGTGSSQPTLEWRPCGTMAWSLGGRGSLLQSHASLNSFTMEAEGWVYGFTALRFRLGVPPICQEDVHWLGSFINLSIVLVLISLEDVLVVGFGHDNV